MMSARIAMRAIAAASAILLSTLVGAAADTGPKKDLVLRGDARCTGCHDEGDAYPVLAIGQTRHGVKADKRTPTCTSCHGESERHVNKPSDATERPRPDITFLGKNMSSPAEISGQCLTCHEGGARTLWAGSRHQTDGIACNNCHTIHTPSDKVLSRQTQPEACFSCHKTERAQASRVSHHPILEGKVVCADCHNPHGAQGPKLLLKSTTNETCWQCHAEKRGPFLWEHPSASDDCMNCHTPHGSTNSPLLRARTPWLCQECHGDGAPHPGNVYSGASLPGGAVANVNNTGGTSGPNQLGATNPITGARITQNNPPAQMAFRSCVNCHQQIHGSNHPAGNRFLR